MGRRLSREQLSIVTVFYHRDFEGHSETKDRYFVVVAEDDQHFFCFTTSTSAALSQLHRFDDIALSSYLRSGRLSVEGKLSAARLQWIVEVVSTSYVLSEDERTRILNALNIETLGERE